MNDNPTADAPEGIGKEPSIRDTTHNLLEAIWLDIWPRAGAIVDFGIDSQEHYEALFYGVREGEITPEALDAALGNGEKLTALARAAKSNPHPDIVFSTSWDVVLGRARAGAESDCESAHDSDAESMPMCGEASKTLFDEWRADYAARAAGHAVPVTEPANGTIDTSGRADEASRQECGLAGHAAPSPSEIAEAPPRSEAEAAPDPERCPDR